MSTAWRNTANESASNEDNLQLACALEGKMDCLVTRDPSGYPGATIPVLTPAQLLAQLAQGTP